MEKTIKTISAHTRVPADLIFYPSSRATVHLIVVLQLEIRNEFVLKGDRVEVSLNATSITILHKKKSFGFYKLKYESQNFF